MRKKGEAGIGTLILFIAMILVAAVAAGVLLQTSSSLQSKALATGSKAQTQISSQVLITRVWGENGTTGSFSYMFVDMKLGTGSDPIDLNNTLVDFTLTDIALSLTNNGTASICDIAQIEGVVALVSPNRFSTQYLLRGENQKDDYLQVGDMVRICFKSPRLINEKEGFRISIIPKSGMINQIRSRTPDVITDERVTLFPI